jgi:uncharacterized membrane protein YfhO
VAQRLKPVASNLGWVAVVEASEAELPPLRVGKADVRIAAYTPDRVVLDVDAAAPSLIVLTDSYDPGWTATVDTRPAKIFPVDILFRGVPVQAGRHEVVFAYRPVLLFVGAAISAAAILFCLGWLVVRR